MLLSIFETSELLRQGSVSPVELTTDCLSHIEKLNQVTMRLAESMMNTAVRGALKGTKI